MLPHVDLLWFPFQFLLKFWDFEIFRIFWFSFFLVFIFFCVRRILRGMF